VCNKITGCDNWLSCEICEDWFHSKCINIGDEAHKVLQELDTCHWFCAPCNSKVSKVFPSIVKLSDRMKEVENQILKTDRDMQVVSGQIAKVKEDMTKDLQKLSGELNNVKAEVDNHLEKTKQEITLLSTKISEMTEGHEGGWNEVVKKHVDKSLETVTGNIQEIQSTVIETKAESEEQRERERVEA